VITKSRSRKLNVGELTAVLEEFTGIFIRLPSVEKLSFTTLSVLHTLSRSSPMRLSELTATEQVTQSAITQLVTRLEGENLVERKADPSDGRAVHVHITATGAAVVDARRSDRVAQLAKRIECLTGDQREAIAAALPALKRVVELGDDV